MSSKTTSSKNSKELEVQKLVDRIEDPNVKAAFLFLWKSFKDQAEISKDLLKESKDLLKESKDQAEISKDLLKTSKDLLKANEDQAGINKAIQETLRDQAFLLKANEDQAEINKAVQDDLHGIRSVLLPAAPWALLETSVYSCITEIPGDYNGLKMNAVHPVAWVLNVLLRSENRLTKEDFDNVEGKIGMLKKKCSGGLIPGEERQAKAVMAQKTIKEALFGLDKFVTEVDASILKDWPLQRNDVAREGDFVYDLFPKGSLGGASILEKKEAHRLMDEFTKTPKGSAATSIFETVNHIHDVLCQKGATQKKSRDFLQEIVSVLNFYDPADEKHAATMKKLMARV